MIQPGLFDEPRTAPATSPTQVRAERIHADGWQELRQPAPLRNGSDNISSLSKGDAVTLGGREYRFHRDCGAFVWLTALDAGIAGPFYWHHRNEIVTVDARTERIKAAQARVAACTTDGPEYMAALGELRAAMREGRS